MAHCLLDAGKLDIPANDQTPFLFIYLFIYCFMFSAQIFLQSKWNPQ